MWTDKEYYALQFQFFVKMDEKYLYVNLFGKQSLNLSNEIVQKWHKILQMKKKKASQITSGLKYHFKNLLVV